MTNIEKTEAFLKEQFANCAFFKVHPADGEYRLQHSYRVAHAAGKMIADRLLYQQQYYEKVLEQMKHSERIEL